MDANDFTARVWKSELLIKKELQSTRYDIYGKGLFLLRSHAAPELFEEPALCLR